MFVFINMDNKKINNNNKIVELYNSGLTINDISNQFNCSNETIRLRLKNMGVDTSKTKDNITCYFCNGKTLKHGFSNSKQRYKCVECEKIFNVDKDEKNKIMIEKYETIKKLYIEDKLSTTEIAKIFNITSTVIQRILQSKKLTRNVKEGIYNFKYKDFDGNVDNYLKTLNEYKKYKRSVIIETNKQPLKSLLNYDLRGINGVDGAYQLDHKFSIYNGFKEKIDVKIIGNIINLEFIPWEENLKKGENCSINKDELIGLYDKDILCRVKTV